MFRRLPTRHLRPLVALVALATVAIAAPPAPTGAAAAPDHPSDALVFVPTAGTTATIWRGGTTTTPTVVASSRSFSGRFSAQPGGDVFLYSPGPAPDGILHVSRTNGSATSAFRSAPVGGTYQPLVGDFDGNGIDDVLWYAPGPAADSLWRFAADGTHTSQPVSVGGSYRPAVVDANGDGIDDVLWYAPGAAADSLWSFGGGGTHRSTPRTIGGDYQPVVGHFFDDDDNIVFYRPGPGDERFVNFDADGNAAVNITKSVDGTYDHTVGDFDGNGYDDIAWAHGGTALLWSMDGDTITESTITTTSTTSTVRTASLIPEVVTPTS